MRMSGATTTRGGPLLTFCDPLRTSPQNRAAYEARKRELAAREWEDMNFYAEAKSDVVEAIIARGLSAR